MEGGFSQPKQDGEEGATRDEESDAEVLYLYYNM